MRMIFRSFSILLVCSLLTGCLAAGGLSFPTGLPSSPTYTPFQPSTAEPLGMYRDPAETLPTPKPGVTASVAALPQATLTATADLLENNTVWMDPRLEDHALADQGGTALALPEGWSTAASAEQAGITLSYGGGLPVGQRILALVTAFTGLIDDASAPDLLAAWRSTGAVTSSEGLPGETPLLMAEDTLQAMEALWGPPAAGVVQIVDESSLLQTAWDTHGWAIAPFEKLEPRWKVIAIDGISPVRNDFNVDAYALTVSIGLQGSQVLVELLVHDLQNAGIQLLPVSNRDASKLTVLAMTGVTALVRATAYTMNIEGITYPGLAVKEWLASADITHISNEAPFAENCPPPNAYDTGMKFCSSPDYIELMEFVGTDIVELTGDHFADWGQKAMLLTLDMYKEKGWPYFGGGYDLADGQKPVTFEHNGNRLAFIGCNAKGGSFATASKDTPGAVVCDFPYMQEQVTNLVNQGFLPVVTFQHNEYYQYQAEYVQERDFRRLADAGAIIVSGSQAHQPQGMEFYNGSFIHYGLGNLFFDQFLLGKPTRQGFIDRHVFYDNRYISTELLTFYFIDFAQPRPMTAEERQGLLETVFSASGW